MSEPSTPRVSVLMTTYNTGELVRETIDAILAQSFTDWELVIVDDCSTDETFDIVNGYQDPRIRAYRNGTNLGISRTRNRAISLASGEYIAATDHDDISLPARLQRQVEYLDAHPEVIMVATAAKELKDGRLNSRYHGEMRSHILAWRLYTSCSIVHSSICYRRSLIEQHHIRYRSEYHYAEDYVLFNEIATHGDIKILPEELVIYRESSDNASNKHNAAMVRNGVRFLQQFYAERLKVNLDEEAARQLWLLFSMRHAAKDSETLITAGRNYAHGLAAFLAMHDYDSQETSDIRVFASQDWWHVVRTFCAFHGQRDATALYTSVPELNYWKPGPIAVLRDQVKYFANQIRQKFQGISSAL